MYRGDHREPIFKEDEDRERFLETLGQGCARSGWQVHALCLMPNHFHSVLPAPRPNLVAGMKWLLGVYSGREGQGARWGGTAGERRGSGGPELSSEEILAAVASSPHICDGRACGEPAYENLSDHYTMANRIESRLFLFGMEQRFRLGVSPLLLHDR